MHKSYQHIKCYSRVLKIIYGIYKVEDSSFSCWQTSLMPVGRRWPRLPGCFGWLCLLLHSETSVPVYHDNCAQPSCHHLLQLSGTLLHRWCCANLRRCWSLSEKDVGVRLQRGPGCEQGPLESTDWQLMPGRPQRVLVPFLVPTHVMCVGCDGAGNFWWCLFSGMCSIGTLHFGAIALNQRPFGGLIASPCLICKA